MTSEEARIILAFHRPDRPRNTERRQLQKAIDVILDELPKKSRWIRIEDNVWICPVCKTEIEGSIECHNFCLRCGSDMR